MRDTQVIGEASDGLNAIRKAEELQPDLIVLDIEGYPQVNGIEAGRRIRKHLPLPRNGLGFDGDAVQQRLEPTPIFRTVGRVLIEDRSNQTKVSRALRIGARCFWKLIAGIPRLVVKFGLYSSGI